MCGVGFFGFFKKQNRNLSAWSSNCFTQRRLLNTSNCLKVKYLGCRIHCHITSGVLDLAQWFPLYCHVRPHAKLQRMAHKLSSAGDPLNSNQCSSEMLVKIVQQHESYTSPRHPKPMRSESSRKTAACGRASHRSRGWPDLAAIGRVKMYGCSYRWDTENMRCCNHFVLSVFKHVYCTFNLFNYTTLGTIPHGMI